MRSRAVVVVDIARQEAFVMALAHALRDKTEAAYPRGDLYNKRARLMTDWAGFCNKPKVAAAVIPIRHSSG